MTAPVRPKSALLGARLAAAVHAFRQEDVLWCLEKGADVDFVHSGEPVLCFAAAFDDGPILDLLLSRGAAVDAPDKAGMTPLHHALDGGELSNAAKLVVRGADVDFQQQTGVSPTAICHAIMADIKQHSVSRTAFVLRCKPDLSLRFDWQGRADCTVMDVLNTCFARYDAAAATRLADLVRPHYYRQQQAMLSLHRQTRLDAMRAQSPRRKAFKL